MWRSLNLVFQLCWKATGSFTHGLDLRMDVPVHRALRYQTDKSEKTSWFYSHWINIYPMVCLRHVGSPNISRLTKLASLRKPDHLFFFFFLRGFKEPRKQFFWFRNFGLFCGCITLLLLVFENCCCGYSIRLLKQWREYRNILVTIYFTVLTGFPFLSWCLCCC